MENVSMYQDPNIIFACQKRIEEIQEQIRNLEAKKVVIMKTNAIPPKEELEALGINIGFQKVKTNIN